MTKRNLITCPTCKGHGQAPLGRDLQATLDRVRKAKKPVISESLMEPGIGLEAICNRLAKLEAFGLIQREGKQSKSILWRASK